jgi:hypothetical protein
MSTPTAAGHEPVTVFEPGIQPSTIIGTKTAKLSALISTVSDDEYQSVSPRNTKSITDAISLAVSICAGSPEVYAVSCLGNQLSEIAASLPKTGDYAESAKILAETGRKLQALARQNRDRSKPPVRLSANVQGRTITTAPLVAVSTASLPSVNEQANAILEEAQTLLLRSVANSDRRKSHYEAISAVVGSSKVLLRSL